jgi:DNA transformation protein and related proteins
LSPFLTWQATKFAAACLSKNNKTKIAQGVTQVWGGCVAKNQNRSRRRLLTLKAEASWLPPFLIPEELMSSQKSNVDYLLEQMAAAGNVSARAMFGEYAFYCDGKVVALFCDDQLFVKPTKSGATFVGIVTEGIPYPGAKPQMLIGGEKWDDADWLSVLVRKTADELPIPKVKKKKVK